MSGPLIVIVAGAITVYLAIVSNDGLVDDDYYKQGLAVNQTSARIQKAISLGLHAEFEQSATEDEIRIRLSGKPGVIFPEVLKLRIAHPTRAGVDQNLRVKAVAFGSYAGRLATRLTGRWHIALEDEKGEWRLAGDWVLDNAAALHLPLPQDADMPASDGSKRSGT